MDAASAEGEFDEAVEDEADPSIDEKSPIKTKGFVARGRRKMRHKDEEVEQAAEDDGGELFEEAGERLHRGTQLPIL